ncbi:hypothetical protein [Saccharomonospora iraqiensis]|uniref:hypothetical protein n=1 Tax=Saccharomonospora iraqiensis TaxID=52698 RepID=UPI0005516781|nr:hypothetical protein [Saccharomonospora iraqiensis]
MSQSPVPLGRRVFLARLGVLGAAVGAGSLLPRSVLTPSASAAEGDLLSGPVELLRPVLAELARDTLNGLSVFALPGPDAYSTAQGTPSDTPGAMEAGTTDFLLDALDNFVPLPDQLAQPVAAALATGLSGTGVALPGTELLPGELATLDRAFSVLLENDATVPLSFPISGLLNLLATQVNPAAVNGPFLSPFARLTFAEKTRAFALLEGPDSDLVALLDARFLEPLKSSVSGLLEFVGGALIEFAAFGAYSEYAVFDADRKRLTGTPVGWRLTGYQPDGPVEGWDEFLGYYQNRTEVQD